MILSKKNIFTILKISINCLCIGYLFIIFNEKKVSIQFLYENYIKGFSLNNLFILLLVLFLFLVNWSLEALKWNILSQNLQKNSFFAVLKAVFASVSVGLFTPQIVGDLFSQKYYLNVENNSESFSIVFIARTSQFMITIFYGALAFFTFQFIQPIETNFLNIYLFIIIITLISVFIFFIIIKIPTSFIPTWISKYFDLKQFITFINKIQWQTHLKIIGLSWLRFVIFSSQYILLLFIFGVDIQQITVILNIWLTFFVKSILPTLNFLNELGVREATAIYFFEKTNIAAEPVLLASLLLWIINIILPSIIGLFVINSTKKSDLK